MKQFAVLALIVLGLVVLGLGGYLVFVDHGSDPLEPSRPTHQDPRGETGETDPTPGDPRVGPEGRAPRPDPKRPGGPPRTTRSAPRSIEEITIPVRLEHGADATVLRGCVLRPNGDPLPSAIVELLRVDGATVLVSGQRVRVAEPVTTDKKGCFVFRGLKGGSGYLIRVEHGSYAPFEFPGVDANPGTETILPDLRVAPGGTIVGTITRPGGAGIEGARVLAYGRAGGVGLDAKLPMKQVLTDERGDFTLANLALGGYALTIEAPEMRTLRTSVIEVTSAGAPIRRDYRLEPGKRLRGKVIDTNKEPIAGATVEAYLRTVGGPPEARAQTDSRGSFELDGLGPDELRVTASKSGFSSNSVAPVDPDTTTLVVVELSANVSITGFVVEKETQKPITSFGLMLWSIGKGDTLSEALGGLRVIERSADGSFTIEDVAPGDYRIQAYANDFAPAFTETFRVKRTHVYGVSVALERGTTLVGRVMATDGEPLVGAMVRMFDNAYTRLPISQLLYGEFTELKKPVTTDSDGRFRFENLAPGIVQLRVQAKGRMPLVKKDIAITPSGSTDVGDLTLGIGGSVRGFVSDADGGVARAARVHLRSESGESETTRSNNDGEYEFTNVPPGNYTLSVEPVANSAQSNFFTEAIAAAKTTKPVTVYDEQSIRIDLHLVRLQ